MVSPDLLKLLGILGGGILVLGVGFIIQRKKLKKKRAEEAMMNQSYSSSSDSISDEESKAKIYIEQYKATYSKDSLKQGLLQMGIDDAKVKEYLEKYFI